MQDHSELAAASGESIVVSKERLKEVIVEVLMWVVQRHMQQRLPRCNCRELNALLSKLVEEVERQLRERGSHHLAINSGVSSSSWSAEEFTAELERTQRKLDCLTLEYSTL